MGSKTLVPLVRGVSPFVLAPLRGSLPVAADWGGAASLPGVGGEKARENVPRASTPDGDESKARRQKETPGETTTTTDIIIMRCGAATGVETR